MKKTFLIADDSPQKKQFLHAVLMHAGWKGNVLTAETSESAMRRIDEADAIHAAFIDYYIPSHNGPAIIAHLKNKFPDAHVALVSSADNERNTKEAYAAGAEAFVCTSGPGDAVTARLHDLLATWMVS